MLVIYLLKNLIVLLLLYGNCTSESSIFDGYFVVFHHIPDIFLIIRLIHLIMWFPTFTKLFSWLHISGTRQMNFLDLIKSRTYLIFLFLERYFSWTIKSEEHVAAVAWNTVVSYTNCFYLFDTEILILISCIFHFFPTVYQILIV